MVFFSFILLTVTSHGAMRRNKHLKTVLNLTLFDALNMRYVVTGSFLAIDVEFHSKRGKRKDLSKNAMGFYNYDHHRSIISLSEIGL